MFDILIDKKYPQLCETPFGYVGEFPFVHYIIYVKHMNNR